MAGYGYSDRILACFLLYRLHYFNKLFDLCPVMQKFLTHQNYLERFFPARTESPEISNFDINALPLGMIDALF